MPRILLFTTIFLIFTFCSKLERNNPYDYKNNTNMQHGVSLKTTSYSVSDGYLGNNDGKINPGESVSLSFAIRNNGDLLSEAVTASFSTASSKITFIDNNSKYFGTITAGDSSTNYSSPLSITVSALANPGDLIPIDVVIKDRQGGVWYQTVNILIEKTDINISIKSASLIINNYNMGLVMNRTDIAYLSLYLQNTGTVSGESIKASLTSKNANISITPNTNISFGIISPNSFSSYFGNNIIIRCNSNISKGVIPITVNILDKYNHTWTSTFNITVK